MKLSSWPEIGSDGDVLLTPYVPKGITGYDDDDDLMQIIPKSTLPIQLCAFWSSIGILKCRYADVLPLFV